MRKAPRPESYEGAQQKHLPLSNDLLANLTRDFPGLKPVGGGLEGSKGGGVRRQFKLIFGTEQETNRVIRVKVGDEGHIQTWNFHPSAELLEAYDGSIARLAQTVRELLESYALLLNASFRESVNDSLEREDEEEPSADSAVEITTRLLSTMRRDEQLTPLTHLRSLLEAINQRQSIQATAELRGVTKSVAQLAATIKEAKKAELEALELYASEADRVRDLDLKLTRLKIKGPGVAEASVDTTALEEQLLEPLREQLRDTDRRFNEVLGERNRLREELARARAEDAMRDREPRESPKVTFEFSKLHGRISGLEEENATLVAEINTLRTEQHELAAQHQALTEEYESLQVLLVQLETERPADHQSAVETGQMAAQERLSVVVEERRRLSESLAQTTAKLNAAQLSVTIFREEIGEHLQLIEGLKLSRQAAENRAHEKHQEVERLNALFSNEQLIARRKLADDRVRHQRELAELRDERDARETAVRLLLAKIKKLASPHDEETQEIIQTVDSQLHLGPAPAPRIESKREMTEIPHEVAPSFGLTEMISGLMDKLAAQQLETKRLQDELALTERRREAVADEGAQFEAQQTMFKQRKQALDDRIRHCLERQDYAGIAALNAGLIEISQHQKEAKKKPQALANEQQAIAAQLDKLKEEAKAAQAIEGSLQTLVQRATQARDLAGPNPAKSFEAWWESHGRGLAGTVELTPLIELHEIDDALETDGSTSSEPEQVTSLLEQLDRCSILVFYGQQSFKTGGESRARHQEYLARGITAGLLARATEPLTEAWVQDHVFQPYLPAHLAHRAAEGLMRGLQELQLLDEGHLVLDRVKPLLESRWKALKKKGLLMFDRPAATEPESNSTFASYEGRPLGVLRDEDGRKAAYKYRAAQFNMLNLGVDAAGVLQSIASAKNHADARRQLSQHFHRLGLSSGGGEVLSATLRHLERCGILTEQGFNTEGLANIPAHDRLDDIANEWRARHITRIPGSTTSL